MDDASVQAPEHRPVSASPVADATGVPAIDLSPLIAATPPSYRGCWDALTAEVGTACHEWGFFVAVGHECTSSPW
ncbi:hypothetical protein HU200_044952 [Digitaria exilis]|uniref:Non-haem dioxygenase N-terminal domain-containing protein n=1 Tax=Digitaria exilis TaxID=1010633 RepID=A0A835EG34_9POAL|nr:hypothetical protein HU200_044952 [Digitaria exilis]